MYVSIRLSWCTHLLCVVCSMSDGLAGLVSSIQCSVINVGTKGSQPGGMAVTTNDKVLCMLTVLEQYVAMGTQKGKILIFDARERTFSHTLCDLGDSVLCMVLFK